jgi:putative transcriptional regulator
MRNHQLFHTVAIECFLASMVHVDIHVLHLQHYSLFPPETGCLGMKTRIKEFRARHDLTQAQLADLLGVRRETISFIEQGKYNPSLHLAYRIARTLKSTLDELYIFDDSDM